ncbi:5-formyltetrahydrofolate cyclo-ligase [Caminibacter mediatlanticus TB-2]|uniref:5-formyltetrahydrofolate cyclo-ligase n=1 Tax=Caminibacter mediatlanticus TB-2 TaxID=391592 RepID=A0AAI9F390_9BACT|nr:5-formyltetrahydrofolate cyclo-ligase [Caminibacter mediatlanticus]EDM24603.1 5-formyltetrahydrofolate cyclo-ligase [Caminibacter mediatlanticus TB-2]QCT95246.1 5-formyltetrahydrofolate cyclo-ligase [Caminibacter mediatlanticus TB-2]
MNNKKSLKKKFRNFCKENLKINRYLFSKIISKELYNISKEYKNILLFIPLENEADIKPLIKKLRREKKNIFVPFMEGLSFKMVKYSLPLKKKKFSIIEPHNKNKTLEKIDLAIVPVLGVDSDFRRIGFGKGMYDRFFESLGYKPKIVFVQIRPCFSKIKVSDEYDIKADEYISYKVRRKNDNRGYSNFFFIRSFGVFFGKKDG